MEFKYTLSESEMVTAMKLHGKESKNVRVALVLLGALLAIVAIFTPNKIYPILIIAGGILGYFSVYIFVIPFQARKQIQRIKKYTI